MRSVFLLLPLLLLACAAPREAAPPTPAASPAAASPAAAPAASPLGSWAFTMGDGGSILEGTLRIDADGGGHIAIPGQGIAADVQDGVLRSEGEGFVWSGRLGTPMGPLSFAMTGTVEGDRMTADNAVPGVGTFALTGQRRPPTP